MNPDSIKTVAATLSVLGAVFGSYKKYSEWKERKDLKSNLIPFYEPFDIKEYRTHYIPTFYHENPITEVEIGTIKHMERKSLWCKFRNLEKLGGENIKYYYILGDTGTGKSTFLVNFYFSQIEKFRMSNKIDITFARFGVKEFEEQIEAISLEKRKKTVLLLDALDEDNQISVDFEKRIAEILELTFNFYKVIMTCRSQLLNGKNREYLKIRRSGGGGNKMPPGFEMMYISYFDTNDINKYLRKKIGYFSPKRMKAARMALQQSNKIYHWPIVLKEIESLAKLSANELVYDYQIYNELISIFLERDAQVSNDEKFIDNAIQLYKKLAKYIWRQRDASMQFNLDDLKSVIKENKIEIKDPSTSIFKSFISTTAQDKFYFSHKSFMEFFLAAELSGDKAVYYEQDFVAYDFAYKLYKELMFRVQFKEFLEENPEFELSLYLENGHIYLISHENALENRFLNLKYLPDTLAILDSDRPETKIILDESIFDNTLLISFNDMKFDKKLSKFIACFSRLSVGLSTKTEFFVNPIVERNIERIKRVEEAAFSTDKEKLLNAFKETVSDDFIKKLTDEIDATKRYCQNLKFN